MKASAIERRATLSRWMKAVAPFAEREADTDESERQSVAGLLVGVVGHEGGKCGVEQADRGGGDGE